MRRHKVRSLTAIVLIAAAVIGIAYQNQQDKLSHQPGQSTPAGVSGFVVFYDDGTSFREWAQGAKQFNEVYLDTASIRPDGGLNGHTPKNASQIAAQPNVHASICISNFGSATFNGEELHTILHNRKLSQDLVNNIARMVKHTPFAGVEY